MKLDIYAHCTIDDIHIGDSKYQQVGGSACYCSHAARKFKFDVNLHTKFGDDFSSADYLDAHKIQHDDSLASIPTTQFKINIDGTERQLYIANRCEPISYTESKSDGVIVNPVMDEISSETFDKIKGNSKFVFLDPQGFLRRVDAESRIFLEKTDIDLLGVTAIKANVEEMEKLVGRSDIEGMKKLQKLGVKYVLCTNKTQISMLDGNRMYSLKIPNKEVYDTTGIGDIFGAIFTCTILKERDSLWALCFAGGSVQAALETKQIGLQKIPEKGAVSTNASYFYNMLDFKQV